MEGHRADGGGGGGGPGGAATYLGARKGSGLGSLPDVVAQTESTHIIKPAGLGPKAHTVLKPVYILPDPQSWSQKEDLLLEGGPESGAGTVGTVVIVS